MSNATCKSKIILVLAAGMLLLSILGCISGSSSYFDALAPIIPQFNTAVNTVNAQLNALIADNTLIDDATWQSETISALSDWKSASEALTNLPEPEEEYVTLNSLVQSMASQSILGAEAYIAAIEGGDIVLMNDGHPYLDQVNQLLPQINTEINNLNQ